MADPSNKPKQTLFTRTTALVWSALSVMLALQWSADLGMLGSPDGYITPFARATSTLRGILTAACMAQGLYFFLAGVFGRKVSAVGLCLQILPEQFSPWRQCLS
ncbi:hypothetical protein NKI59_17720 [Mesorhizobium sp. M0598]|uniref:hypothetical protein n=1 Tax=Mesorhizobium sp. M0598 TaxID=2956968 RepID=UPI0033381254